MQRQVANECCKQKGGVPVAYSGCQQVLLQGCENAHKEGWYCEIEGSEINYSEVFKGCEVDLIN